MINRFKLLDELAALQQRLNTLFDDQLHNRDFPTGTWAPQVDIFETDDEVVVSAELPGVKRENIEVTVTGDKLVLRGNRPRERDSDGEQFHRMECQYGSFYRAFNLPQDISADTISARMLQGVLILTLPKRVSKAQQIQVD